MKRRIFLQAGLTLPFVMPLDAFANTADKFPSRPISMVVPFTPAGPTDALARSLAAELQMVISKTVVVENKPGAAGNIGAAHVARSAPDGYTLLFASSGPLLINTSLFKNPGFDPLNDFTPISYIGEIPNVLVVNVANPAKTLSELIAFAKDRSDLAFGSSGNGSTNHLIAAKFNKDMGTSFLHVPYKGTAPAVTDLIGGQTTMMYLDVLTAASFIKGGRLRALGVASAVRSHVLPDVPTFREQGVASLERGVAFGLLAPAKLPNDVRDFLVKAVKTAIDSPKMQSMLRTQGVETGDIKTPDAFGEYIRTQVTDWRKVIQVAGITPD